MDPSIGAKIKQIYIMGGTTEGRGNQTMAGEFNIHSDPEGADIVISSMPPGVLTLVQYVHCEMIEIVDRYRGSLRNTTHYLGRGMKSG